MSLHFIRPRDFKKRPLTDQDIERAYLKCAKLVSVYGDKALPIFERLNEEMERIKKQKTLRDLASKVANDN